MDKLGSCLIAFCVIISTALGFSSPIYSGEKTKRNEVIEQYNKYDSFLAHFPAKSLNKIDDSFSNLRATLNEKSGLEVAEITSFNDSTIVTLNRKSQSKDLDIILNFKEQFPNASIEPNYFLQPTAFHNDTFFSKQWALQKRGLNYILAKKNNLIDSKDQVVVAVIDTGINTTHPDLVNSLYRDSSRKIIGYNTVKNTKNVNDEDGHGTHVAGIIAATPNNKIGVVGICKMCKIMPIKVFGPKGASMSDIVKGIKFAVQNGAEIINMSLGSPFHSSILEEATDYAIDNGLIVVAASGNDSLGDMVLFPAGNKNVLAVGATTPKNKMAYYSNYSSEVDFFAPGGAGFKDISGCGFEPKNAILSTLPTKSQISNEIKSYCASELKTLGKGSYGAISGTSMASPYIAGVLGVTKSKYPTMDSKTLISYVQQTSNKFTGAFKSNDNVAAPANVKVNTFKPDLYKALTRQRSIGNEIKIGDGVVLNNPSALYYSAFPFDLRVNVKHHFTFTSDRYSLTLTSASNCISIPQNQKEPKYFSIENVNQHVDIPVVFDDLFYGNACFLKPLKFNLVLKNSKNEVVQKKVVFMDGLIDFI